MPQKDDSSSNGSGICATEIKLFGVRIKVDGNLQSANKLDVSVPVAAVAGADSGNIASAHRMPIPWSTRGIRWSEDEHKLFLEGLLNAGDRDWKGISRNYVKTRTPKQVASHAQSYFLRQRNRNQGRCRSSLFDITTDSVAPLNTEEQVNDPPSTLGFNNGDDVITVN